MSEVKIGKAGRHSFTLPAELATQAMAIHGVRGKGKTVTATVIAEELLEIGVQVVVIDPTDSWWGLKSSADGKSEGYPLVILGGPRGDLPLSPTGGRVIADFAVERGASMILSLRHMRKGDARRFVTDFAEQLFHRKGEPEHRTPLFLVIDECSQYLPQRVMGESARMVGALQDCVRMGRNAGLGIALIDQRPASVNKDALTQVELMVCHAVTSPQDRKALDEWIKGHDSAGRGAEFLEGLASLERGEAWFWYPIDDVFDRVHVRMRHTFDSSRTPKLGETLLAPEREAEIDLKALQAALDETLQEAEANDPAALKKRIRELEAELRRVRAEAGLTPEEAEQLAAERAAAAVHALRSEVRPHVEALHHALANGSGDAALAPASSASPAIPARTAPRPIRQRPPRPTARRDATSSSGKLTKGQRIILTAVAQNGEVTREQLSVLTGYKRSSRDTYLQQLRQADLISAEPGGSIMATELGIDALGDDFEPLPVGDALREHWLGQLPQGERVVLEAICARYPDSVHRDEISDETPYKRSSRDTYIQRLSARKLVTIDGPGVVRASDALFPGGLR